MFNGEKKHKKKKAERQDWKPNFLLRIIIAAWHIAFGAVKIAAGAAATVLMIGVICGFVFAGVLGDYLQDDILPMADIDIDNYELEQNSYLYYVDDYGRIQKYQDVYAATSSSWVDFEDIPEAMIYGAVAIEDHRFFEHQGVDWITTIKACARMFFGDSSAGGSSITQQLIKNILLTEDEAADDVTVQRKVLEIFRAVQVEKRYDKDEILELYLNFIYLGQGCRGIRSAAATYFGKEVEMLTPAECASIISITNSPTYYDPYQNFENNHVRKENVLWVMRNYGWLTEEEYQECLAQELVLKSGIDFEDSMARCVNTACKYKGIVSTLNATEEGYFCPQCGELVPVSDDNTEDNYSWFTDTVLEDVCKALAEKNGMVWNSATQELCMQQIQRGGYHIYTTIDLDVQEQVDRIYTDLSEIPETRSGQQLQSAVVVIDNETGDIVALAGGVGEKTGFDEWNRATDAELQSGSVIKPLSIYAPGFEQGTLTPASVVLDLPMYINEEGAWPLNDTYTYGYSSTILSAVVRSVNAVAARSLEMVTTDYAFDFAKNKFGVSSLIEAYEDETGFVHSDNDFAPLAMGAQTWGVHVRDMANAYATFPNNGVYREARTFTKVYDSDGNLVLDNTQDTEQILSAKAANYMNYCLVDAVAMGTGWEADFSGTELAGKTGSTDSFKDRWFCGYSAYYSIAVWSGYDSPERISPLYCNNPSSVLAYKVLEPLHEDLPYKELYDSEGMVYANVCLDSGLKATSACSSDVRGISRVASALVYPEDVPTEFCDKHVTFTYCSGGGIPTEWCRLFAADSKTGVTISTGSYVNLTSEEYNLAASAVGYGLDSIYVSRGGILTGSTGSNCSVHTEEAWKAYQEELKNSTSVTTKPTTEPTKPGGPTTPTTAPTTPTTAPTEAPTVPSDPAVDEG